MMVNEQGLLETLALVEEAEKVGEWDQSRWVSRSECGTAFCFAGHYCLSKGYKPKFYNEKDRSTPTFFNNTGDVVYAEDFATSGLQLTSLQAGDLFCHHNTLDDLRRVVAEIIAEGKHE